MSSDGTGEFPPTANQTLTGHLIELRKRLVWSLFFVLVGFIACFSYSEIIFELLRRPILPFLPKKADGSFGDLVFLGITDPFMISVKLSAFGGAIITAPLWLYQVWSFVAPGLYKKERAFAGLFVICGTLLFLMGASFAYFLALPSAYEFLLNFGGDLVKPMITIQEHISFLMTIILVFGAVFEMPLVLTLLAIFGIIDAAFLVKYRRYAIVVNAIIAAIFSPPDVMSMVLVLVPMTLLYEVSIIVIRLVVKKKTAAA